MATRTVVTTTCDRFHDEDTEAAETIPVSIGGEGGEIDLCSAHAEEFRKVTAPWLAVAHRPASGSQPASAVPRTAAGRRERARIRAWAKSQGMSVADYGRMSAEIYDAYAKAHRR